MLTKEGDSLQMTEVDDQDANEQRVDHERVDAHSTVILL